jgi:hypothetical protein
MRQYSFMNLSRRKRNLLAGSSAIALVVALCLWALVTRSAGILQAASSTTATHGTYTTNFPLTENPISEGGKWINGKKDGVDWTDVRTTPGLAFGTEIGGNRPELEKYDDSTALLTGTWGPNQTAQATVRRVNKDPVGNSTREVELRLRSAIAPHNATGYEVMFSCSKSAKAYTNIARWDGILGAWMFLQKNEGPKFGVKDGDVIKASMVGKVFTVWVNGVKIAQTTDYLFTSGNPGIGFYQEGVTGGSDQCGLSNFTATDK